jgi:hypothetical protein
VSGSDESEIRRFFDDERLSALAETESLLVVASGDTFTVERFGLGDRPRPSEVARVAERVEEAEALLRVLSKRT